MGFARVILLSVHAPNNHILYLNARKMFEKYNKPVFFIDPYKPFDDLSSKIFEADYEKSKEASLVLAALTILGKSEMCYEDQAPPFPEAQQRLKNSGKLDILCRIQGSTSALPNLYH